MCVAKPDAWKKSYRDKAPRIVNILLFLIIVALLVITYSEPKLHVDLGRPPLESTPRAKEMGMMVNTSNCRIDAIDYLSPVARQFMVPMPICRCYKLPVLKARSVRGRNFLTLTLNSTQLWQKLGIRRMSRLVCAYIIFERVDDFSNRNVARGVFGFSRGRMNAEVEAGNVTLRAMCWVDFSRLVFHDVYIFLSPAAKAEVPLKEAQKPANHLSVMVLGIDSISHMHYKRYFSNVMDFVDQLPHVELWGYHRIGRNSYPNLVPLLSGQSADELESAKGCYGEGKTNFDGCNLLWNEFKKAGFVTMFGEDTRIGGTFTYGKRGFSRQPTDYYYRSVMVEVHQHTRYLARGPKELSCSGNRVYHHVLYDFIYLLMPHFKQRCLDTGFFAFFWQTQGVHDYFPYALQTDIQYDAILRVLHRFRVLENTLVLLLSDHGLRYGSFAKSLQGMREMSLPTMVAVYPSWLERRFPLAVANLQANAHRLVTTFDLHETIQDVINLENLSDERIRNRTRALRDDRNVSLFLPIPEKRSCKSANIPYHYCQCQELTQIPWNTSSVRRVAQAAVDKMNELLRPYPQCHKLKLLRVNQAYLRDLNQTITVRLETVPGRGKFDATVLVSNYSSLQGPVTRTDQYKKQSFCAEETPVEMYCYCFKV
ncbi:hypothetical protein KR067_013518 [Drosophila pandora]|nr:hypothetical protein KR067_013518 [Drosophila pandora]